MLKGSPLLILEIDGKEIKGIELLCHRRGYQLLNTFQATAPSEELPDLVGTLKTCLIDNGIGASQVELILPPPSLETSFLEVPLTSKKNLKRIVQRQVKTRPDHHTTEGPFIDYKILSVFQTEEGTRKTKLIITTLPPQKGHLYLELMSQAGLTLSRIGSSYLSLLGFLQAISGFSLGENELLISLNRETIFIWFIVGGELRFYRTFEGIRDWQGLTEEERAEERARLEGEVRLSFRYYQQNFKGNDIHQAIIIDGENLTDIEEDLTKLLANFDLKVRNIRKEDLIEAGLGEIPIKYCRLMGNLLAQQRGYQVNLLPQLILSETRLLPHLRKILISLLILCLFGTMGLLLYQKKQAKSLSQMKTLLERDIRDLRAEQSRLKEEIGRLKIRQTRVRLIDQYIPPQLNWPEIFLELGAIVPDNIALKNLTVYLGPDRRWQFKIEGIVRGSNLVLMNSYLKDFVATMRRSPLFFNLKYSLERSGQGGLGEGEFGQKATLWENLFLITGALSP